MSDKLYTFLTDWRYAQYRIFLLIIWSFLESSFWFISADFLLLIYAFYLPKKAYIFAIIALIASIAWSICYFLLLQFFLIELWDILRNTPFVVDRMFSYVESLYMVHGESWALYQWFSFMSSKIWVYLAVEHHFSIFPFIMYMTVFRIVRFVGVVFFGIFLSKVYLDRLKPFTVYLLIAYSLGFFWLLFFLER